jgi:hypothetical protein
MASSSRNPSQRISSRRQTPTHAAGPRSHGMRKQSRPRDRSSAIDRLVTWEIPRRPVSAGRSQWRQVLVHAGPAAVELPTRLTCTAARWPHPARRVRPTAVRTRVITNLCSRLPHHSLRRPGLRPAKHGRPVGGPARPLTGAGSAQSMDERSLARGRCTHRCPS